MQAKLTTKDLPLILIVILGSVLLIFLLAEGLKFALKKSEVKNMNVINIPFIIMYASPLVTFIIYSNFVSLNIPRIIKLLYIIVSVALVIIPTAYNIVRLGLSGILVSFFQSVCGLMLGAIALASVGIAIVMIVVGGISVGMSGKGKGVGPITLRSVDDGTVVHIHEYDDCWKDDGGNCYYNDGGRWYDDSYRYYTEL